jgi:hypothetical protein
MKNSESLPLFQLQQLFRLNKVYHHFNALTFLLAINTVESYGLGLSLFSFFFHSVSVFWLQVTQKFGQLPGLKKNRPLGQNSLKMCPKIKNYEKQLKRTSTKSE